jgi:hypothetical protein
MRSIEIKSGEMADPNEWDQSLAYMTPNWEVSKFKVWERPEILGADGT